VTDGEPAQFVAKNRERLVETTLELLSHDTQNPPGETGRVQYGWCGDDPADQPDWEAIKRAVDDVKPT